MDNPFAALAAEQVSAPVKARQRAAEKRRERSAAAEKQLAEDDQLLKLYRRHKREQVKALLAGPFGQDVRGLMAFMRTMTLSSAPALVRLVRESVWIKALPADQQYILLGVISHGITKVREREGLEPYFDGVYGDAPRAFEQIKTIIGVR